MVEVLPRNGLTSTLTGAIGNSATVLTISSGDAPYWPSSGEYRCVLWQDALNGPWELVKVVGGQGTATLTIERAAESYHGSQTALAWPLGTPIAAVLTQDNLNNVISTLLLSIVTDEFVPASGATQVTLTQVPDAIVMVARSGVIQSEAASHYSVSGSVITFASSFSGSERVVVSYGVRGPFSMPDFVTGYCAATGGWADTAATFAVLDVPPGSTDVYVKFTVTARTGTPNDGWEFKILNTATSAELLGAHLHAGSAPLLGYQESRNLVIPGGVTQLRFAVGVWDISSNPGTLSFVYQLEWLP